MSPTCEEMLPLLSSMADGRTTPVERKLADQHLAECAICRTRMQRLGSVQQHLEAYVDMEIPVGFAERTARMVLEKAAAPPTGWARLLDLPRRIVAWMQAAPDLVRVGAGIAGLTAALAGAGTMAVGSLLHGFSVSVNPSYHTLLPGVGSNTVLVRVPFPMASSAAEADHWKRLLPAAEGYGFALALLLSLLTMLCGFYLLRTRAAFRDLIHARKPSERPLLLSGVVRGTIGFLLLGPVAALPVCLFNVVCGLYVRQTWDLHDTILGTLLYVAAWGGISLALGSVAVLARAVREAVPATAPVFAICFGLGLGIDVCVRWLLRLTYAAHIPHAGWVPTTASEVLGIMAMIPVVFTPSELLGEILVGCLSIAVAVGLALGLLLAWREPGLPTRSVAGRVVPVVLALGLLGGWSCHFHGLLASRGFFEAPLASQLGTMAPSGGLRTVAVLCPRPGDAGGPAATAHEGVLASLAFDVPAGLDAVLSLPGYRSRMGERFGFSTPSLYRLAILRARLDWDDGRVLELYREFAGRVPGGNPSVAWVWADNGTSAVTPAWESLLGETGLPHHSGADRAPAPASVRGRLVVDGGLVLPGRVRLVRTTEATHASEMERRRIAVESGLQENENDVRASRDALAVERAGGAFLPRGGDLRVARVNVDGTFHFDGVPPGRYLLAVQWPGRVTVRGEGHLDEVVVEHTSVDVGTIRLRPVDNGRS